MLFFSKYVLNGLKVTVNIFTMFIKILFQINAVLLNFPFIKYFKCLINALLVSIRDLKENTKSKLRKHTHKENKYINA